MNPESLQPREQRALAVVLLVAVLLLLGFGIIKPIVERFLLYNQTIEDLTFRIDRLGSVAATAPALAQEVEALNAAVRGSGLTLDRQTSALAAAEMQRSLGELVEEQGGEITSTQVVPVVNEQGFVRVGVRVQMSGDSNVLAGVLESVESGRPLIFVDNIRIRERQERRVPRRSTDTAEVERIDIQFDAFVYMRTSDEDGT